MMSDPEIIEREWTDEFGTHYEVRGKCGKHIASQKVTRLPLTGWPKERGLAYGNVVAALATRVKKDQQL